MAVEECESQIRDRLARAFASIDSDRSKRVAIRLASGQLDVELQPDAKADGRATTPRWATVSLSAGLSRAAEGTSIVGRVRARGAFELVLTRYVLPTFLIGSAVIGLAVPSAGSACIMVGLLAGLALVTSWIAAAWVRPQRAREAFDLVTALSDTVDAGAPIYSTREGRLRRSFLGRAVAPLWFDLSARDMTKAKRGLP
jgi:hypothetical protein